MNLAISHSRRWVVSLFAMALFAAVAVELRADEPLVWKFEPGLVNRYQMVQKMDMAMDVPGSGKIGSGIEQTIDMSWTVEKVNEDGSAVLKQKIDRMRMKITLPQGQGTSELDSASKKPAEGQAALMAPMLKAMTADAFTVRMEPTGEVIDVEVPEKIAEALANMPGAALLGEMATPDGLKKLVKQASFALPEKLESDSEWTTKLEIENPMTGPQIAETTYKYEGQQEIDGKLLEVFKAEIKMSFGEGGAAKVDMKEQESSGEILFNREDGRLESSSIVQSMSLKITVQGQVIDQELDQTVKMKWMPEKKKAAAEEKK